MPATLLANNIQLLTTATTAAAAILDVSVKMKKGNICIKPHTAQKHVQNSFVSPEKKFRALTRKLVAFFRYQRKKF